jgi:GAF domain-containing protein
VVEEVFRRVIFEAPRFGARPEKFHAWLRATIRDCASAIIARRMGARPAPPVVNPNAEAFAEIHSIAVASCHALLRDARLPEALAFLNSLTPFRFTAIYRFDGMSVENIHLFDRQAGFGSDGSVSPVSSTYCVWIQETMSVVQMKDSRSDPRASLHPKRDIVRSYCGGPIFDATGNLIGTVCHFDYEPRETPSDVLALLEAVGPMLVAAVASAPSS